MEDFLFNFHAGWRNIVVLATILVLLFFVFALVTKNTQAKQERIALAAWAGVIDVQLALGIVLLVLYTLDDRYYGQLTGHWTLGVIAAFLAHVPAIYKRLNGEPNEQTRRLMGVGLPIAVFATVYFGLSALPSAPGLFGG